MRRCAQCRLLFEALEGTSSCVVCGVAVDGLALPLGAVADSVPSELGEREPTTPHQVAPRGSN